MKNKTPIIALFISLFITIVCALDYMVTNGLQQSRYSYFAVWNDIYGSKINSEMIFLGNSRTFYHISPKILDSVLNIKTYNLGISSWGFPMQDVRFKIYLGHNKKPKYIIQNVDFYFLEDRVDLYDYEQFLPYLQDTTLLYECNKYKGAFTIADRYIPLFKYNNQFGLICYGILAYFNIESPYITKLYKGFTPLTDKWDAALKKFKKIHKNGISRVIPQKNLHSFEQFITYCQLNNIQLILEFAPIYYESLPYELNRSDYFDLFQHLSQKYNIPYLDYSKDTICYRKKYFSNINHLNQQGSEIFSQHLALDLKHIIEGKQIK